MILDITAKTKVADLLIDYIEVRLKDGREISLNWDESMISRSQEGFGARYKGIYFGEEYANGQIKALEGLKVLQIQTYSETEGGETPDDKDLVILSMEFTEGTESLTIPIDHKILFQHLTGMYPSMQFFETIESYFLGLWMETEGKLEWEQFCRDYRNNTDGLAEKVQEASDIWDANREARIRQ